MARLSRSTTTAFLVPLLPLLALFALACHETPAGPEASSGFAPLGFSRAGSGSLLSTEGVPIRDLGTLGGTFSVALDVSRRGHVVGWSRTGSGDIHAFLWAKKTGMTDLGTLGGSTSQALGVNRRGQVVGSSRTASGETHAFLWTKRTGMIDLGTLGGSFSEASAINDRGQIVGASTLASGSGSRAFVWERGQMRMLPDPPATSPGFTRAEDINNRGQVAGWCAFGGCLFQQAVLWDGGAGAILDIDSSNEAAAFGLSDRTLVVGRYLPSLPTPESSVRAFLWRRGNWIDLGTLGGRTFASASDIRPSGKPIVVGTSGVGQRPFVWTPEDGMRDLGTLGGSRGSARAVNRRGQIAGFTTTADGEGRAVLWELP